jgi:hypothetical protein
MRNRYPSSFTMMGMILLMIVSINSLSGRGMSDRECVEKDDINFAICSATFTNNSSEVGLLWEYFGNDSWSNNSVTIQPGQTYTQSVEDGEVWQIWNQADDRLFAEFNINCSGNTDYSWNVRPDCCEEKGDVTELMFRVVRGGCVSNSQDEPCSGTISGSGPFSFSANDKSGDSFQTGNVAIGETFTISDGGNDLSNPTEIVIGGQSVFIHTSCSQPIIPGERFGGLELVGVTIEGSFCGEPCPNPGISFESIQCLDESQEFSITSPDGGVIYRWDFGEGANPSNATGAGPHVVSYS